MTLTISVRPSDRVRVDGSYAYQDFWRRSDGSLVGRNVIPRLKVEYQLTRSIFLRVVGEYDLSETNDLRDETRTNYPLLVNGSLALATRSRALRGDYLFSYHAAPRHSLLRWLRQCRERTTRRDAAVRLRADTSVDGLFLSQVFVFVPDVVRGISLKLQLLNAESQRTQRTQRYNRVRVAQRAVISWERPLGRPVEPLEDPRSLRSFPSGFNKKPLLVAGRTSGCHGCSSASSASSALK